MKEVSSEPSATVTRIRNLCMDKGISIAALEKELGFSNGSVAKAKNMSADRIVTVAKYFGVTPEYLIAGEESNNQSAKTAYEERNAILMEIVRTQSEINSCYEKILKAKERLEELQNKLQDTYK